MTLHEEMRLVVDGSKCDGHGICTLVLPEVISLDPWGYAVLAPEPLDDARLIARARRVVRACPAGALTLLGDPHATTAFDDRDAAPSPPDRSSRRGQRK
ncbi:MAG: ferredoxin [Acidobacteria bacterium]|nr:ferredoxin [Acidobacteriota bacterium]